MIILGFLKSNYSIIYLLTFFLWSISLAFSQNKNVDSLQQEKIAFFFPALKEIEQKLDLNAPMIKESMELLNEAESRKTIADSAKGFTARLNIGSHSIHEDRPGQGYSQSYRTIASISAKKPLYHWGLWERKVRLLNYLEN